MEYNYKKLKQRILEIYNSIEQFSQAMHIAPDLLQEKLSSQSEFTADEIKKAYEILELSPEEIRLYFFTTIV